MIVHEIVNEGAKVGHVFEEKELFCTCAHMDDIRGESFELEELLFWSVEVVCNVLLSGAVCGKWLDLEVKVTNVE